MFLFPCEVLNSPRQKTTFFSNFCHLFPVLFYEWNTSTADRFPFLGFYSRNHFLEGGFTFQWRGIWFSVEWDFNFKRRCALLGTLALMGGWFSKNTYDGRREVFRDKETLIGVEYVSFVAFIRRIKTSE